jgi:hypothetical protein
LGLLALGKGLVAAMPMRRQLVGFVGLEAATHLAHLARRALQPNFGLVSPENPVWEFG